MNATNLYISTCRLVLKADFEQDSSFSDLDCLLVNLRLALSCSMCNHILNKPYSPKNGQCLHHVCKTCLMSNSLLKLKCSLCTNPEMYSENKQLTIILECYSKLCDYIRISPVYQNILVSEKSKGLQELVCIFENEIPFNSNNVNEHFNNKNISESPNNTDEEVLPLDRCVALPIQEAKVEEPWCVDGIDDQENNQLLLPSTNLSDSNDDDLNEETHMYANVSPMLQNPESQRTIENFSDSAPVLSPIPEQSEIDSVISRDVAPALSPVLPSTHKSSVSESSYCEKVLLSNLKIPENQILDCKEPLIPSNYETESNSNSSPLSSISSPLHISPTLPSQEDSSTDPIQDQLDEFNLVPSLTTASVLDLPSSPDLVETSAADVLESLEDTESYDLSNISLTGCPLSAIGEQDVSNDVITLTDSVTPFSSLPSSSNQELVKVSSPVNVTLKIEVSQSTSEISSFPSTSSLSPLKSTVPINPSKKLLSVPVANSREISIASNPAVIPASSHLLNSIQDNPILNKDDIIFSPSSGAQFPNSTQFKQSLVTNFSPPVSSHTFLTNTLNPCMIAPLLSPTIKSTIMSPNTIQSLITTNNLCHINNTPIGQSSPVLQNSVIPNAIIQQSIHPQLLQKALPSESLLVQKTITPHYAKAIVSQNIDNTVVSSSHGTSVMKTCNLLLNPSTSTAENSRLIVGNCNPNPVQPNFHVSVPQQKLNSPINQNLIPFSVASSAPCSLPLSFPLVSSTQNNPSIAYTVASTTATSSVSSNFLNILPAGTIFSTNVNDRKPTPETPTKINPVLNNGSSLYSVMFSEGDSTKITIKRTPPDNSSVSNPTLSTLTKVPQLRPEQIPTFNMHNNQFNQNLLKKPVKPKAKPKPKPKRKGCRCGNATPSPGKLTCCGQRCPCYVEAKACIDCRCKGCRNPHRPGGKKVRPVIPPQANIRIHQIKPIPIRPAMTNCKGSSVAPVVGIPLSIAQQFHPQGSIQNATAIPNSYVSSSTVSTTSSPTLRTLQAIHAVKTVQGITSVQGLVSGNQLFNVKNTLENVLPSNVPPESVSMNNMIPLKPVKFQIDSSSNQIMNLEQYSHVLETDCSDVEIDS